MTETIVMNNAVAHVFVNRSEKKVSNNNRKSNYENSKERMKNVIARDGGKFIYFDVEHSGLLVAGVEHNKKMYFMILNKNREFDFISMKESYTWLKEIPGNLSVLSYLYQHERQSFCDRVEDFFEDNGEYTLVGEIGIHPMSNNKKYNKNGKNKSKKFTKKNS